MKLESGKVFIKDTRFDDKTHVKGGVLHVNKEEVEKLVLEDDKLTGCHVDIAKPGESVKVTPVKDVIEPEVKVNDGEIFPGVTGKVSPQVGTGRTHTLEGCCVVTVGRIVGSQEGVTDMSGPVADYYPFSQTCNLCVVVEPADDLETHVYEEAAHMANLKVATYVDEAAGEPEPDEIITYETKPIFEQAAMYPGLPKVGYIHMLQLQGLLHGTYCYGVDTRQFTPTFMYPTGIVDDATVSGNCVVPCDKVTTYHHFHNSVIEDCRKHYGKDISFVGVILTNENVFLANKECHSDVVVKLCNWMGLDGVLITEEGYGNPDTDPMMNCRKVEHVGTKVAPITGELPGKGGKSQSLADVYEEVDALTSYGQGNVTLQFLAIDRVIGTQDFVEMQIGGWDGCKSSDSSFETELQIITAPTITDGFDELTARSY